MKNTIGTNVALTIFGESHGRAVGAVLDGLAPGITVDEEFIRSQLALRRSVGEISTPRKERDEFSIVSGVFEGKTTGTPICILIPNEKSLMFSLRSESWRATSVYLTIGPAIS